MKYPYKNETGYWSDTMDPYQRQVWEKLRGALIQDWPDGVWAEVTVIGKSWDIGISGDILLEAIACWTHYNVIGGQVSQDLKRFMDDKEELFG
jgi:hypothetical protein